jgi:CRISPR-associated protein Csd1
VILQALNAYYERMAARPGGKIAPPGYSYQPISFCLVLREDGAVVDVEDLRDTSGGRPRPRSLLVPQPPKRAGRKPPPCFLWDKTAYVLGLQRSADDKTPAVENIEYREAFREYHTNGLGQTRDIGMRALLAFMASWEPSAYPSLRYADDLLDTNVVFRLDGELGYLHERPEARESWARLTSSQDATRALCLVSGEQRPTARLHPSIKGVLGAQTAGASIVSFNQDAFTSYGKDQGDNAPVSEQAAFAYTTALNDLLRRDSAQRLQIGDATTVYWAEADDAEKAEAAEHAVSWLLDASPGEKDTEATARLRADVMDRISKGRPLESPELNLDPGTRFYILGLAPNAARLSVRFWEATTLGQLGRAFHDHYLDLYIDPLPWKGQLPALWRLLYETAAQRKAENIPRNLAGEFTRALIAGTNYPLSLLGAVIRRIRADGDVNGMRAAIIKATLVRPLRRAHRLPKEDALVSLDRDNTHVGYRLGRLFAVIDSAQRAGVGAVNASVRDKFISTASAAPSRVFPILLRGAQDHLSATRKKGRAGRAVRLEKEIAQIMEGLDARAPFPSTLPLTDQGHFFVGFYHQQSELFVARQVGEMVDHATDAITPDSTND